MKKDWDSEDPKAFNSSNCMVFKTVETPVVCLPVMNNTIFGRLRNIKQLGIIDKIFVKAVHTRFEHSLGVADLARRVMKRLREVRKDITGNDELCVIIAGLCRNLGYGPFSHIFDPIMNENNVNFKHEKLSVRIFEYMLKTHLEIENELRQYLSEDDFEFIKEMIDPPENFFDHKGKWTLKGRPKSKHYLYEIVNNPYHGIDIDTLDFLVRDAYHTDIDISVTPRFISHWIQGMNIHEVNGMGILTFSGDVIEDIQVILNSIKTLSRKVYFDRRIFPLENGLQKVMELALKEMKFGNKEGERKDFEFHLIDPINIDAFKTLDDRFLIEIRNLEISNRDIHEIEEGLERIDRNRLHSCIAKIKLNDRLKNIKQLGIANEIFMQAAHTRLEHSLGTADLARRVMKQLKKKRYDITGNDMLCVIIAGLCHDLGHTPFSRSLSQLIYKFNGNFRHSEMSVKLFDYMLENEPEVREKLGRYLDDTDFTFIKEMIDPPESFFDSDGNWALEGRPASKQYLYEIVNNVHHGLDIDKLDHHIRDSHHTGVNIAIGPHFISRFINGIDIQEVDGEERLMLDGELAGDIPDVFNSRKSLFMKVYFHREVYPLEYQLQKAIELASPHLKFKGEGGRFTTLRESLTEPIDIKAYSKLDDHVLFLIQHSEINHPDMIEAKKCIEKIEKREVHTVILKVTLCNIRSKMFLEEKVEEGIRKIVTNMSRLKQEGEIIYKIHHHHFRKEPNSDHSNEALHKSRSNDNEGLVKRTVSIGK
ncbi:hypothetical protein FO519_007260 [Halicephalobus sp. NKZ332]|nr:hypothetical protein FO519_007260 [Halicephalobus sp. NKZ332]